MFLDCACTFDRWSRQFICIAKLWQIFVSAVHVISIVTSVRACSVGCQDEENLRSEAMPNFGSVTLEFADRYW